jgi:iron-sulfur cluster assembly protein
VRLGVKTTGCSGLAYKLEYVDEVEPEDMVFESHGVKVLIDPRAWPTSTAPSWISCAKVNFKFHNPNERDRCGCGESFRI